MKYFKSKRAITPSKKVVPTVVKIYSQEFPAKIAKWILTIKRYIKSYFYSKFKPKYNAAWKTEIFAHIYTFQK